MSAKTAPRLRRSRSSRRPRTVPRGDHLVARSMPASRTQEVRAACRSKPRRNRALRRLRQTVLERRATARARAGPTQDVEDELLFPPSTTDAESPMAVTVTSRLVSSDEVAPVWPSDRCPIDRLEIPSERLGHRPTPICWSPATRTGVTSPEVPLMKTRRRMRSERIRFSSTLVAEIGVI